MEFTLVNFFLFLMMNRVNLQEGQEFDTNGFHCKCNFIDRERGKEYLKKQILKHKTSLWSLCQIEDARSTELIDHETMCTFTVPKIQYCSTENLLPRFDFVVDDFVVFARIESTKFGDMTKLDLASLKIFDKWPYKDKMVLKINIPFKELLKIHNPNDMSKIHFLNVMNDGFHWNIFLIAVDGLEDSSIDNFFDIKALSVVKSNLTRFPWKRLNYNNIQNLPDLWFCGFNEFITQLAFTDNLIKLVTSKLNGLDLEEVDLRGNKIHRIIDYKIREILSNFATVNLSKNNITTFELADLQAMRECGEVNLRDNPIRTISVNNPITSNKNITIIMDVNTLKCDCKLYKFHQFMTKRKYSKTKHLFNLPYDQLVCGEPMELKGQQLRNISPICNYTDQCPLKCQCSFDVRSKILKIICNNQNFTNYPEIEEKNGDEFDYVETELHLENNNLNSGPIHYTGGYLDITKLYLSGNKIENFTWVPPQLKILHLGNNRLSRLSSDLNLTNLEELTLVDNPWDCDCTNFDTVNLIKSSGAVVNKANVKCSNDDKAVIDMKWSDCNSHYLYYANFLIPIVIISILTTLFLYFKQPIKVFLYARHLCLCWVNNEELDEDRPYDAFISYSHKDENFVVENLISVLESGPNPYKLCVYYRNWVPGELISHQITISVLESKRTLVVLSNNFLESVWGKLEFRTAHTQAMADRKGRVIIVLYGDIDRSSLDEELNAYLKTNTYLEWGDPFFWNKLKYALPHSKTSSNDDQEMADVSDRHRRAS